MKAEGDTSRILFVCVVSSSLLISTVFKAITSVELGYEFSRPSGGDC